MSLGKEVQGVRVLRSVLGYVRGVDLAVLWVPDAENCISIIRKREIGEAGLHCPTYTSIGKYIAR
jgi:hypothetical protein